MGMIHINIAEDIKNEVKIAGFTYSQVFMRGINALRSSANPEKDLESVKYELSKRVERLAGMLNKYAQTVADLEDKLETMRAERG